MQTQWTHTTALLLLTLGLSMLSYRFVELPFWKGKFSHQRPRTILFTGVAAVAMVCIAPFHPLFQPTSMAAPPNLAASVRNDVPVIYRMACDTWFHSADVQPCVFEAGTPKKTIVLMGDSIGVQWFSALPELFKAPEWRIVVFTKSACPMVDEDFVYQRIGHVFAVCTEWRNNALATIASLKPNVVIVGSAATYDFNESQWVEGSARVLGRLSRVAQHVLVIPGTPSLTFDGPSCMERHAHNKVAPAAGGCLAPNRKALVDPVTSHLIKASQRHPNIRVIDLNSLVCPAGDCAATTAEGVPVFRDSQHLTNSFVLSQLPALERLLTTR